MPSKTPQLQSDRDERLSQLLALKRLERPDAAFWTTFEQEFRSKQLSSLVRVDPWFVRYGAKSLKFARKAYMPSAIAVAVVAGGLLTTTTISQIAKRPAQSATPELATASADETSQPQFVVSEAPFSPVADIQEPVVATQSPAANYQISVMAKAKGQSGYQLHTTPVTFTQQRQSQQTDSNLGAQVIKTNRSF